jgi:glycine/sarcosine N-methyltransferase
VGRRDVLPRLRPGDPDLPDRRPVLTADGRPLYHELAWAYDALVTATGIGPAFVARVLEERGVAPGALVVDAGCGTGAHARELVARGYGVIGIDRSPELVEEARRLGAGPDLVVADLLEWRPPRPAAAVLCRGVLNDLVADAERDAALPSLAAMLAPGGVLVADVRDWERSAARYAHGRTLERRAGPPRGEAVLRSRIHADPERRALVVDERIEVGGVERRFEARMRPWTAGELETGLRAAGFGRVDLIDPGLAGAREDRIVVVASR